MQRYMIDREMMLLAKQWMPQPLRDEWAAECREIKPEEEVMVALAKSHEAQIEYIRKLEALVEAGKKMRDVLRLVPKDIYNDSTIKQAHAIKEVWDKLVAEL